MPVDTHQGKVYNPMPRRPRSKSVRQLDSDTLHAIARLWQRLRFEHPDSLSDKQEWYWDQIVSELEWRAATNLRYGQLPCHCDLCQSPFPAAVEDETPRDGATERHLRLL